LLVGQVAPLLLAGHRSHCAGLPVLGHRQQPDAQIVGLGCAVHCQQQRAGGGCRQLHAGPVLGATWPAGGTTLAAMGVGLLGYGLSLVLFVLALRGLGTARTGAYFSTAPGLRR
jgi:hypothetical protein